LRAAHGGLFTRRFAASAALLIATAGALGCFLWLRDSSLVRVEHVKISGLTTRDAPAIRRTLRQAALRMTTLHYDTGALERAVEGFPAVESVRASADLPDTLEIRVREHRPVAALESGDGRRIAVASDGTLLPRSRRGPLPSVKVDAIPNGGRLDGKSPEEILVLVLAGAPAELRPLLDRAYRTADGVRVAMRTGPTLRFGAPRRLAAKWAAVTRVMADPSSGGASELDVRLPERPAATFEDGSTTADGAPATSGETPAAAATGPTGTTGATGVAPAPAVPVPAPGTSAPAGPAG
jgi:cell division protein FtsQ